MFTAEVPPELLPRCLAAPSLLAEIITDKFSRGLPLYRQEQELFFESVSIDRGTMCRWLDLLGSRFNETIVAAMERDAKDNAFCIATDATGFAVQPGPLEGGPRRPCRKGHYFVRIADRDHILFSFTERQRSEDVATLFRATPAAPGRRLQRLQRALPARRPRRARRRAAHRGGVLVARAKEVLRGRVREAGDRARGTGAPARSSRSTALPRRQATPVHDQGAAPAAPRAVDRRVHRLREAALRAREEASRARLCCAGLRRPSGGPPARRAHGRAPAHRQQLERARTPQGGPHPRRSPLRGQHRPRRERGRTPDAHRLCQAPQPEPPRVHPRPDPRPPAGPGPLPNPRRSSGTRRAPGWTLPNSRPRPVGSPCPTRLPCAARARNRP
ncbi:MAG: transposase, partial [Sandaracinaceae bacterium]|nr:transposase [Sandaracinaceae bacterium]